MHIVLCIDDDPITLQILEAQLRGMRCRVFTEMTAQKGIETSKSLNPDLILLDINMPHMNGFEFLEHLRKDEITKIIPVIMLTSSGDKSDVIMAMRYNVIDYITKPYDVETLESKIGTALRYNDLKRNQEAYDKTEKIMVSFDDDVLLISFKVSLNNKRLIEEAKTVFNKVFLKRVQKRKCVFDLRQIHDLDKIGVLVLTTVLQKFIGQEVYVVTGRHYADLVAETELDDQVKLFISFGDMEYYLHGKK